MRVEILDETAALEALAPEWAALWDRVGVTPFQHPAWLLPWWGAFGTGRPRVAVVREGGVLEGVLAAYVLEEGGGPKLLPMGAGTSDYLDALGSGVEAMIEALLGRAAAEGVGRCDWIDVPPWSSLRGVAGPVGWAAAWSEGEACPVLRIAETPAGMRRKLRMARHRAERSGGWTMDDAGVGGLEALVDLHQARWTATGEAGVMADAAVLGCLRTALPALAVAGLLRLRVLRVAGVVAAAILAMLGPGRVFFYLSGYDVGQGFVSPGTLLLGAMLEEAEAEGRLEAHFLRGREGYKYAWGGVDRLNGTRSFVRRED